MPSTRDIRRRIKSVKNTRQITKAMELVAASKMKKAQQAALAGRRLCRSSWPTCSPPSASRVDESFHPFLVQRPVKTRGIILVTTDKGLCGPLNGNLFRLVLEIKEPAKFAVIGRKGSQFLARTRRDLLADFQVHDRVPFRRGQGRRRVHGEAVSRRRGRHGRNHLAPLQEHPGAGADAPAAAPPAKPEGGDRRPAPARRRPRRAEADDREMLFEPSPAAVLAALLPLYVNREVYQRVLDAKASEQSARMVAMKTAKDNATKLIDDLTLEYNKVRQASITQEILEISAAQNALR